MATTGYKNANANKVELHPTYIVLFGLDECFQAPDENLFLEHS